MKIFLTLLACVIVTVLGVTGFVYWGVYDIAAVNPDDPLVAWALHKTADQSADARLGDIVVPPGLDKPEVVRAGGALFGGVCVTCHGGPGLKPSDIALGLNPPPASLFDSKRQPRMNEMYWFIKNGVKMTAMPSFGKSHSDNDIWALAAFLQHGPGMSPQDFSALTGLPVQATIGSDSTKANGG